MRFCVLAPLRGSDIINEFTVGYTHDVWFNRSRILIDPHKTFRASNNQYSCHRHLILSNWLTRKKFHLHLQIINHILFLLVLSKKQDIMTMAHTNTITTFASQSLKDLGRFAIAIIAIIIIIS